jgi:hypothetical protein
MFTNIAYFEILSPNYLHFITTKIACDYEISLKPEGKARLGELRLDKVR